MEGVGGIREREGGREREEGRGRGERGGGERASTNQGCFPVCSLRLTWTTRPVKLPGGRQGRVRIEDGERDGWASSQGLRSAPSTFRPQRREKEGREDPAHRAMGFSCNVPTPLEKVAQHLP